MRVVIVHHVEIPMSTPVNPHGRKFSQHFEKDPHVISIYTYKNFIKLLPWHSLDKTFSEVIEGYSDLHVLVLRVRVTVS